MKKLTIRLSDELHEELVALARKHQRSVNREVIWQMEQVLSGDELPTKLPTDTGVSEKTSVESGEDIAS